MNEITLLEDFDYTITSVRDTDWYWVDEGGRYSGRCCL